MNPQTLDRLAHPTKYIEKRTAVLWFICGTALGFALGALSLELTLGLKALWRML